MLTTLGHSITGDSGFYTLRSRTVVQASCNHCRLQVQLDLAFNIGAFAIRIGFWEFWGI